MVRAVHSPSNHSRTLFSAEKGGYGAVGGYPAFGYQAGNSMYLFKEGNIFLSTG
jgi:hypothetical protein